MKAARGFSLVELMIAIVLGLLVTDAMVAMFVSVRTASRTSEGVAGLSDSGRYALDTIEQAVRGAGNLSCDSASQLSVAGGDTVPRIVNNLDTASGTPLLSNYDQPLSGYEAVGSAPGATLTISATPAALPTPGASDWLSTPALGGNLDGALVAPPIPAGQASPVGTPIAGSDVLVVHETLTGSRPAYITVDATGAAAFTISSGTAFTGADQIAAISNCAQGEIFELGGFASGTQTVTLGGSMPGNVTASLNPNLPLPIGSQVDPIDVIVFYVGIGADGDGALFKYDGNGGSLAGPYATNQELVPDVENMQILYGVETALSSGTETAAQYVTADQVAAKSSTLDFTGVISVKIALLVASPPGAVPQGTVAPAPPQLLGTNWALAAPDNRIRKVYEQTMFLRNMSP